MDKITKGAVFTAAVTIFFNLGCVRAHDRVLAIRNQNQMGLQAIVDYRRKKLDEEWDICNEIIEKMGKPLRKPVWSRKKKTSIFSRSIILGKRYFKLWLETVLGRI